MAQEQEADIRLYLAGSPDRNEEVVRTVRSACATRFGEQFVLDVIDVLTQPLEAEEDSVDSVPTLVLRAPEPGLRIIGDLLDAERLVRALGPLATR